MKGTAANGSLRSLRSRLGGRSTLAFIVGFLFLAGAAAIALYHSYARDKAVRGVLNELEGVADLKAEQVAMWRANQLRQALVISENPVISARVRAFLATPADAGDDLAAWLSVVQRTGAYHSVLLANPDGSVRLRTGTVSPRLGVGGREKVSQSIQSRQPLLSDLHYAAAAGIVHLDLVIPLIETDSRSSATCVGAIVCRIDPTQHLFPLVRDWPRPSATAEALLVRSDGAGGISLSECRPARGRNGTLGDPSTAVLSRLFKPGNPSIAEGADPSGVPVLAAMRQVPATAWSVVAKMDCDEALSRVRKETMLALGLMGGALLLSGAAFAVWEERRRAVYYRHRAEAEHERRVLLQRYEWLTRYAHDIIVVADADLHLIEVNERAVQSYGYPRNELLGMPFADLFASEADKPATAMIQSAGVEGGLLFETCHRRKDRMVFPVEISLRTLQMDGHVCHVAIIRDITERKRAEALVREMSLRDELTGLLNRRGLVTLGQQGLRMAARLRNNAALVFIDVDGLKTVNDAHGHEAGDALLKRLARLMRETCRESDLLARLGGDEFVILTVGQIASDTARLMLRLDQNILSDNARQNGPRLGISMGVAHFDPDQPVDLADLLRVADHAMYEAKGKRRR